MLNYYSLLRQILFTLPPERSHHLTLVSLQLLAKTHLWPKQRTTSASTQLMGLIFPNRLGLAAGLDKNGDYITGLAALGFGFIELGTVTPKPQIGNPKPRLFRLPEADALINRMGFNNKGIDHLIARLQHCHKPDALIGINIGKNATTPVANAVDDYIIGLQKAYPWADYITINISSPNTKNLRDLQQGSMLTELLEKLKTQQKILAEQAQIYKPLVVKIAPDLNEEELKWLAEQIVRFKIDGVIATNTTVSRKGVEGLPHDYEQGGLSGRPLMETSTQVLKILRKELGVKFPLIGVGGIMSAADAAEKIAAGANLLQIYTGLIYRGPKLIKEILKVI
ncbi:MAG: quinone-dependent dihydroorotate dehydrogenase [Gammaproteobacteria bacterium]